MPLGKDMATELLDDREKRPLSQQTLQLVIAGRSQVMLITLTMATVYSIVPVSRDSVHNTTNLKLIKLNRIQPSLMLLLTPVLSLLCHVCKM